MPRTVLIIDDERDANDILAALVQARGFQPVQIFTGGSALDAVGTHDPDLILLDLMLPDLDGYSICEQLKRDRRTNLAPIIMVTALNDPGHQARGVRVGANAYLPKPFTPAELFAAMDRALAWRHEHQTRGTTGEVVFDIRGGLDYLHQTNDLLADLFAHTPLTDRQVKDLRQAVMEMGTNAIEWGHRKDTDLPLHITYRIDPTCVSLIIRDEGPGFNVTSLPHAARPDDPLAHLDIRQDLGLREGGFGIMLARGLVDEMRYNDKGNEVTLIKRFCRPGPPGADHAAPG